jgi:hypothetical protein
LCAFIDFNPALQYRDHSDDTGAASAERAKLKTQTKINDQMAGNRDSLLADSDLKQNILLNAIMA